jgi:cytochrome bd-type quinol oxidase subunit 1
MDTTTLARSLFGSSMAFHIIFSTLGVGIPVMIIVAEVLYQWKKDRDYAIMAKRWTRGFGILLWRPRPGRLSVSCWRCFGRGLWKTWRGGG